MQLNVTVEEDSIFPARSAYESWIESQGVPIYQGDCIPDLNELELDTWKRLGCKGAFAYLRGGGGASDAFVCWLEPGQRTRTERHLYEEWILVLDGQGGTVLFDAQQREHIIEWQKGSLISIPLNVPHAHFALATPVRFVAVTSAPLVIDLFHNLDFVFGSDFAFQDRYQSEEDYFTRPGKVVTASATVGGGKARQSASVLLANMVRDVHSLQAARSERATEVELRFAQLELAQNTMTAHLGQWPTGTYMPAHFHGPGAHIIILSGEGYTLLWRGDPQYSRGYDQTKLDWHSGSMLAVPGAWFHQHFNVGKESARVLAIRWGSRLHRFNLLMGEGGHGEYSTISIRDGGNQVTYQDEDPRIREMYEEHLAKAGLEASMPRI